MLNLKTNIKKAIKSAGFTVQRLNPISSSILQLLKAINHFDVDMVLDVGANVGQFGSDLRSFGYTGGIVSFEPLSSAYNTLKKTSSKDDLWQVHPRCAIGNCEGEIEINISGNSVSSSVLSMTNAHSSVCERSVYIGAERTRICTLDSVSEQYLKKTNNSILKIDTQGYEWQVLEGASETLKQMKGVICESSLLPLYEGQYLWMDIIQRLEQEGFRLWAVQPAFIDIRNGRTLQVDGVFFR